ncbi:MAG: hypothetical protein ABW221_23080 [Vicinamibacteria bacterium]
MNEGRASNPLVDQFRKGGVPPDLRLLAAQGALPLTPSDLVELLHLLLRDPQPDVRDTAAATLLAQPLDEMLGIGRDRQTPPGVLAWIVAQRPERELREAVLQNTSLHDDAIQVLAGSLSEELAELVVINQTRLLRSTPLLEALEVNPSLSNDQRRRLRELRETFKIGPQPDAPPPPPVLVEEPPPVERVDETLQSPPEAPATESDALVRYLSEDERGQADKVSAVQRIYRLNTAEKIITALKGSREERSILVRDANRLVSTSVLGSPRLTEAEIESFAGMKSLSDEMLRIIGNHREWTKRYQVVANLVKNPKTPIGISLGLVSRLNPRDIKGLTVDRNVPEVVRKHAQKFLKGPDTKK